MQIGCTDAVFDGGKMSKGIYRSAIESGKDLVMWLDYNTAPSVFASIDAFSQWLKDKGYYQIDQSEYTKRLKQWM